MELALHSLCLMHPKLRGHPIDLAGQGALALQRAGHRSPVRAPVLHDAVTSTAAITWVAHDLAALKVLDRNRVTEDGAEAVALAYVYHKAGWVVKRRMHPGESADWLLQNESGSLVLEVSGTTSRDGSRRLKEKREQVGLCTLARDYPVDQLAVVVAFGRPAILAACP